SGRGAAAGRDSTIADTPADAGGGLFALGDGAAGDGSASVNLVNTILAGTTGTASDFQSDTAGGAVATGGSNNLISTNPSSGGFSGTATITGVDPLLGALGLYGGPTPTIPL